MYFLELVKSRPDVVYSARDAVQCRKRHPVAGGRDCRRCVCMVRGPAPRPSLAQRFVPYSSKLRTARFEHANRRFAELLHIDHAIKICPLPWPLGQGALKV